jgi:hypothetical protein
VRYFCLILAASPFAIAQISSNPVTVQSTVINNITISDSTSSAQVIDNRSSFTRQNNMHTFCATGTGTWSVQLQYSDSSISGPWSNFTGGLSQVTNTSTLCIGGGYGYHEFIGFSITGSASVSYTGQKGILVPLTSSGGGGGGGIFASYQFGSQTAITGANSYLQTTYPNIFSLAQTGAGTSASPFIDAISLASQTQNLFFASPNGSTGTPVFRAIVAADVPTLNQSTTGNAATATLATSATNLASYPNLCGSGNVSLGLSSGSNNCSAPFSLTTSGTSGAATYSGGTLNIPQYTGGSGGGLGSVACSTPTVSGGAVAPTFTGTVNCASFTITEATTVTPSGMSGSGPWYYVVTNSTPTVAPLTYSGTSETGLCQPDASSAGAITTITMILSGSTLYPVACNSATATSLISGQIPASQGSTGPFIPATQTNVSAVGYVAGGGTANAQTVTLSPAVANCSAGLTVKWTPVTANTSSTPTLAVNSCSAATIVKEPGNAPLAANDLIATAIATAIYDGTYFELQNPQTASTSAFGIAGTFTNTAWTTAASGSVNSASAQSIYQLTQGSNYATNGLTGAVVVPSSATIQGANGLFGGIESSTTGTNAVGVQGYAYANAASVPVWGANFLAQSASGLSSGATLHGIEVDVNSMTSTDNPTGISIGGTSSSGSARGLGIAINSLGGGISWLDGLSCAAGATSSACINVGPTSSSNNVSSQVIQFASKDSGGSSHVADLSTLPTGGFVITPDAVNNSNTVEADQTGTLIVSKLAGGGTQCVQVSNSGQFSGTGSACGGSGGVVDAGGSHHGSWAPLGMALQGNAAEVTSGVLNMMELGANSPLLTTTALWNFNNANGGSGHIAFAIYLVNLSTGALSLTAYTSGVSNCGGCFLQYTWTSPFQFQLNTTYALGWSGDDSLGEYYGQILSVLAQGSYPRIWKCSNAVTWSSGTPTFPSSCGTVSADVVSHVAPGVLFVN